MSGKVRVTSLRGLDLVPQDGKTCDPFVELKVGERTFKTEKISSNHSNPVWHDLSSIYFQWDGRSPLPELELVVYDYDFIGSNDFIGYARVQLYASMMGQETKVILGIRNEKDSGLLKKYGTLGAIFFKLEFEGPPPSPGAGNLQPNQVVPVVAPQHGLPPPQVRPQPGAASSGPVERQMWEPQPQPPSSGTMAQQQSFAFPHTPRTTSEATSYRLTKLRAENLAPVDGTTCDPYAKVVIGTQEITLEKQAANRNPVWASVPAHEVAWDGRSPMPAIEITITDSNRVFSDEFLGFARMQLHPAMFGTETRLNLTTLQEKGAATLDKHGSLGVVYFTLDRIAAAEQQQPQQQQSQQEVSRALPPRPSAAGVEKQQQRSSSGVAPLQQPPYGGMSFRVRSAKNIAPRDVISKASDPFVVVCTESTDGDLVKVGETRPCESTTEPVWNADFFVTQGPHVAVHFVVLDKDPHGVGDFLGAAIFTLDGRPQSGVEELTLLPRPDQADDAVYLRKIRRADFGTIVIEWLFDAHSSPLLRNGGNGASAADANEDSVNGRWQSTQDTGARGGTVSRGRDGAAGSPASGTPDVLTVTVLCISNLQRACDPYVSVEAAGRRADNAASAAHNVTMAVCNFTTKFALPEQHHGSCPVVCEVIDAKTRRSVGGCQITVAREAWDRQQTVTAQLLPLGADRKIVPNAAAVGELTLITSIQPGQRSSVTLKNEAVLRLCVVSAHGIRSPEPRPPNPYVTVAVVSDDSEIEYRSATVRSSSSPQWYFNLPSLDIAGPNYVVHITLWDEDPLGFDEFLGQTRLAVGNFTRGITAVELQLEDRADATGAASIGTDFGKIVVEWAVERRVRPTSFNAPRILEVNVLEAEDLAVTDSPNAVVHVSCDDQPNAQITTALVPKKRAVWNEGIQIRLDGGHNQLRLAVWDDASRSASFLGEYVCHIGSMDLENTEVLKVNLRPRRDPQLNSHDVALLNRSPKGLGTLRFTLRLFTLREYERRTREKLKAHRQSYAFVMQVSDTADIPRRSNFYIRVSAAGEDRVSQTEGGAHPKFRKRFTFDLHYETELVTVALVERSERGVDTVVGEVAFPVSSPDRVGSEPIVTWVDLKGPSQGNAPPPKLLIRWRTYREGADSGSPSALGSPSRVPPPTDHSFIAEARNIGVDVPFTGTHRDGQTPPPRHGANEYFVNVYSPDHASVVKFATASPVATASDAIAHTLRELGVRVPQSYSLIYAGMTLPPASVLLQQVPVGETVFLVANPSPVPVNAQQQMQLQQAPRYDAPPRAAAATGGSPQHPYLHGAPNVTSTVIERLISYGGEAAVVTAAVTLPVAISSAAAAVVIDLFHSHRVNGFGRPVVGSSVCEFFAQGAPRMLAALMREVANAVPGAIVEEVKGYIPMLGSGFRTTASESEAANMFTICSTPYASEAGLESGQSWFYKSISDVGLPGVRYIDERA